MKGFFKGRLAHRRAGRMWGLAVIALAAIGVGSIAVLAGGAGASGTRQAVPTRAAPAVSAASRPGQSPSAVRAYWTKARMARATPMRATAAGGGKVAALNAGNTATGRPGTAGGYVPRGLPTTNGAAGNVNRHGSSSSVLPADGGFPGPNDTFDWYPRYRTYPQSTVGKLFFKDGTSNFVCTASVIYGGGNTDTIVTAGHCIGAQGGQRYYSDFLFCPSYINGANPAVGCWPWAQAQQTGGWYFNGYWAQDYAWIHLAATGDTVADHVANVTGGLGWGWNFGRDQHWMDWGYPSGSPYSGGSLVVTAAEHRYDVNNGQADNASDNSMGSAQTPGFSGGPWVLHFGSNAGADPQSHGNWVNSVNSYYFTGGPNGNEYGKEIQGPYFDTAACNFLKGGTGWTGTC